MTPAHHFRRLALLAALSATACQSSAFDASPLLGHWKVTDTYCRSCKTLDRSDIGTVMHLEREAADNPLVGGRCPGKAGYREVPPQPTLRNTTVSNLAPAWVKKGQRDQVRWVAVTCDGLDFTLLMQLPDGSLGYTDEGEIAYRLEKAPAGPELGR